jgi:NAD(P)-dependent dehydrogenase (short-subunit alcohol dehydrogenase family)
MTGAPVAPGAVVITGSTRGIGRGLAAEVVRRGRPAVVCGTTREGVAAAVADLAGLGGGPVSGQVCDVTDHAAVQRLWDHAAARFGRVEHWTNNAGAMHALSPLVDAPADELARVVAVNLTGVLNGCRVAARGMRAQVGGTIWNVEGFGADGRTGPGLTTYGATKRAVRYLSDALVEELAGSTVRLGTLSPGVVLTDLTTGDPRNRANPLWWRARPSLQALGGTQEDVCRFLCDHVLGDSSAAPRVRWLTRRRALRSLLRAALRPRSGTI